MAYDWDANAVNAAPFTREEAKVYAIAAAENSASGADPTLLADAASGNDADIDDRYDQDFGLGKYGFGDPVILNLNGGAVETTNKLSTATGSG